MKRLFGRPPIFIILLLAGSALAQECPVDMVCISRQAAITAVENAEKVKALEAEGKVKDQALKDKDEVINKLKVEYAEAKGEISALKQNAVSDRAIITTLLQHVKRKCSPFAVCIGG